jgi:DUF4097 and DUF4098 domain-containing protein YvlB
MRRFVVFLLAFCAIVVLGALLPQSRFCARAVSAAQLPSNWHGGNCPDDNSRHWGQARVCQLRTTTFSLPSGHMSVDTTNGGIQVDGEDRSDVSLEARVHVWAPTDATANNLLNQVSIDTENGVVRDHGPKFSLFGRSGYSVDYHLRVPRHLAAEFHSMNGGIELASLDGKIRFGTTNGGIDLSQLSGDVQGNTVNGGMDIALTGDHWQGEGLQADTTNGGIELHVPDNYSAHLETSTVNGGISIDFPITIQGEIKNHLDTNLGSGGATIHAQTVNGGVTISHGGANASMGSGD